MRNYLIILAFLSLSTLASCAQNNAPDYNGEWIGHLPDKSRFNFKVSLELLADNNYHLTIANARVLIDREIASTAEEGVFFNLDEELFFNLKFDDEKQNLTGFIQSGRMLYRLSIPKVGENTYVGFWNSFMVDTALQSDDIMLYVEKTEGGNYVAYPFFGDQRFRGTYAGNFNLKGDTLHFTDGNTGFKFRARFAGSTIELEILLTDKIVTTTSLTHTDDGWEYSSDMVDLSQNTQTPTQLKDGWSTASLKDFGIDESELQRMIESVHAKSLVNTHSVLIAKENKLIFETYFDGFNARIPHDLRSASKSISSAVIGIAIADGYIKSVDEKLYDFLPQEYQYTKDSLKSQIRIKDLLTMSSGLDVNNKAFEDNYQDPQNPDSWLKTVLEAPMVKQPGTYADYGSANPFLLGVCLDQRLDIPLKNYMDQKLFAPLGITNYINQTDDTNSAPYFGGGMLLTPRDLLKFGQLYLNKGQWNGRQILSEAWVAESFKKQVKLQDVRDKNEYGYLWWHDTYQIGERNIESIEARGAGGQFIFILPELDAVVVITSGNFRNRKGNQSREILKDYILPALLN